MNFASDNAAGIAPEILAAIARANDGAALAYGRDGAAHLHFAVVGHFRALARRGERQQAFALHEAQLTGAIHDQTEARGRIAVGDL